MKKIIFPVSFFLFIFSLFLTSASADNFSKIYMVSDLGNTTQKTDDYILGGKQPWFYIQFSDSVTPATVVGNSNTTATWAWDDNPSGNTYLKFYNSTLNGAWGNLGNWNSDARLGNWSIQITTPLNANPGSGVLSGTYVGNTQFKVSNVVPEPVSCILFLLGGGALAGVRKLRRKQSIQN